jgi:hypothetical protein
MKTIVKFFALLLVLTSCTTKESEVLHKEWYTFTLLAQDSLGHVDTVYMDGVTASHLSGFPLTEGEAIDIQKTSIGYVYSSHDYITKEVTKNYLGLWTEKDDVLLPIEIWRFKSVMHGACPEDPLMKMLMMPR